MGVELAGFGYYLNRRAQSVIDPLFARAVMLETDNAKFFQDRGMAYYAKNDENACRAAVKILYDPNVQAAMRHAQKLHIPTDASRQIARFIIDSVQQGKIVQP